MIEGLSIHDDFLPNASAIREAGLRAPYADFHAHDGETYKRVCLVEIPGVQEAIEQVMGPVDMLGMGFRLNFGGEVPNAAVHSDIGWGSHAMVLYLNQEGEGGTAFWSHEATGAESLMPGDLDLLEQVKGDWNRRGAWRMRELVPIRFNRAILFESTLFHSRYPFEAFGSGFDDGRLVAVAFFTPAFVRGSFS